MIGHTELGLGKHGGAEGKLDLAIKTCGNGGLKGGNGWYGGGMGLGG